LLGNRLQKRREIRAVARIEEHLSGAANVPRCVATHGLIPLHAQGELGGNGHSHEAPRAETPNRLGSSCETTVMCPAPMVTMRSPSWITSINDWANSSTLSTKIGSTSPRPRTARQMALPSAPGMGVSPAAYTSVTNSASAAESALLKSSIRSCVLV